MASDAGEIFDELGGDAMAIAELLVQEQRTTARLQLELTAAQAAIGRVRDLCKPTGAHLLNKALFARDVLRALDGDTTEEKR